MELIISLVVEFVLSLALSYVVLIVVEGILKRAGVERQKAIYGGFGAVLILLYLMKSEGPARSSVAYLLGALTSLVIETKRAKKDQKNEPENL
jgi:hypothetical protein